MARQLRMEQINSIRMLHQAERRVPVRDHHAPAQAQEHDDEQQLAMEDWGKLKSVPEANFTILFFSKKIVEANGAVG